MGESGGRGDEVRRVREAREHGLQHQRLLHHQPLLPGAGAALSVLFLTRVVREKGGHGVPEVIYSVSRLGGRLSARAMFSRLVASSLTIGSGGSAGPESPVVISGAAIGSNIARFFSMNERQRVTLLGCGAAGAISSTIENGSNNMANAASISIN